MSKCITIDRSKPLKDEPHAEHNRWHPDISPVVEVDPIEGVTIETPESSAGKIGPGRTAANLLTTGLRPLADPALRDLVAKAIADSPRA